MMKDIKTGFKLMRYGAQFKYTVTCIIIILAVAIICEVTTHGTNFLGGFYLLLLGIFPMQLIFSTDVSTMIQTTHMKRKIQITIPITVNMIMMTVAFTVVAILRAFEVKAYPEDEAIIINNLILISVLSTLFLTYMGAAFKHFLASIIIFMIAFFASYIPLTVIVMMADKPLLPFWAALVLCYVCIVVGLLFEYLLLRLFYKHEMSKYAFGAQIRKMMS